MRIPFPRTHRQLLAALALFSAFMLGSALIGQYGFSLYPCDLCIYQRIACYHTGVEYGWFKGPDACSNTGGEMTIEEMRAAIMAAPLVTCDQAMAYIFGLSMAAWNAMMAFAAGAATLFRLRKTA